MLHSFWPLRANHGYTAVLTGAFDGDNSKRAKSLTFRRKNDTLTALALFSILFIRNRHPTSLRLEKSLQQGWSKIHGEVWALAICNQVSFSYYGL